jgi:hypothetical protein
MRQALLPSLFGVLLAAAVLSGQAPPARAESNPELQNMVDELRSLTERSREQRAADRWLQQALEDLVSEYDWPWRRELLSDGFSDGNYTESPSWQVISGEFWVDRSLGLRSSVEPPEPARAGEETRGRSSDSGKDLGGAIFDALLNQALERDGRGRRDAEQEAPSPEGPARIRATAVITNAFSLELTFSVHGAPDEAGLFEVALLQDPQGEFGYALAVRTGDTGLLDLYRLRQGRRELVSGTRLGVDLGDGSPHRLVWRQAPDDRVQVLVDGEQTMDLQDRAFREGYDRLELVNRGGELAVRSVTVLGTSSP